MKRTYARECAVHIVYSSQFAPIDLDGYLSEDNFAVLREVDELSKVYSEPPDDKQSAYIRRLVGGVDLHLAELDNYIEKYLRDWGFGRIPRMAVAILRVCMFEVLYVEEVPPKAAMNAAVDIAKLYEPEDICAFVNGILASFYKNEVPE